MMALHEEMTYEQDAEMRTSCASVIGFHPPYHGHAVEQDGEEGQNPWGDGIWHLAVGTKRPKPQPSWSHVLRQPEQHESRHSRAKLTIGTRNVWPADDSQHEALTFGPSGGQLIDEWAPSAGEAGKRLPCLV